MRRIDVKSGFGRQPLDVNYELPAAAEPTVEIPLSAEPDSGLGRAEPGQIETVEQERDALRARLARLQADFDNARKRTEKGTECIQEFRLGRCSAVALACSR